LYLVQVGYGEFSYLFSCFRIYLSYSGLISYMVNVV